MRGGRVTGLLLYLRSRGAGAIASHLLALAQTVLVAQVGIGLLVVSFAFGLTVLTMAYAIGHISGCHLNPAVSIGLAVGGRFPMSDLVPYVVAQVLGATVAAFLLYFIASGQAGFTLAANSLAVNGFGDLSPGKYSMVAGFVTEAGEYQMVILEEANVAVKYGLFPVQDLLRLIIDKPVDLELVITGRGAAPRIIEAADLVTEMKEGKHYYEKGVRARSRHRKVAGWSPRDQAD